jgi:hypothetical protein
MASRIPPLHLAGLLFLGLLWGTTCYRAATQSVVHDEALTWELYLAGPVSPIFDYYDANHHFLATLLERISTSAFGFSELSLRLPTLLAGAWYFWILFRLCRLVFGQTPMFAVAVVLAGANPLILDFLVAARGYGLALAFLMHALFQMVLYLAEPPERRGASRRLLYTAAASLSLAVAANLTFLLPALSLAVIFILIAKPAGGGKRPEKRRQRGDVPAAYAADMRRFVLTIAVFALGFCLVAPLDAARVGDFYAGASTLKESLRNAVDVSFAHNAGIGGLLQDGRGMRIWLGFLGFALPLLALIALGWGSWRFWRASRGGAPLQEAETLLLLTSGAIGGSVGLLIAAHYLIGFPYPADRTGLYFPALMALCLPALAAALPPRPSWLSLARPAGLAFLILLAGQFLLQWNTSHFYVWRYDADSREILTKIQAAGHGQKPAPRIGISWQLEPSFNFYRTVKGYSWLPPFDRRGPDGDYDYYVLLENDRALIARRSLRPIYQGPVSGTVLAVP